MQIDVVPDLAVNHALAAALFCRLSHTAEDRPIGWNKWPEADRQARYADHRAYVIGAIFCSVAFAECTINHCFAAAVQHPSILREVRSDVVQRMRDEWLLPRFERTPTLEKFNRALELSGSVVFKHEGLYAELADVIYVRNFLTHFKPEKMATVGHPITVTEFQDRIERKGFRLNPFLCGRANPFFPDKCLGHGCASWATMTSLSFVDEFYRRIGMMPPYEHVRTRLSYD